jgi:hypothetical protein
MITKLRFNSILGGAVAPAHLAHLVPSHCSSLPDEAALKRSLAEVDRATDKIEREREQLGYGRKGFGFGARIAQAVRARTTRVFASAAANEGESFGQKVKRAAEKQGGVTTKKQHAEQAEKERSRYPQRRKRGKGE